MSIFVGHSVLIKAFFLDGQLRNEQDRIELDETEVLLQKDLCKDGEWKSAHKVPFPVFAQIHGSSSGKEHEDIKNYKP